MLANSYGQAPLASVCEGMFDGPHATPKKTSRGPVFLGIWNLSQGRLDLSKTEHLSEEDFARWTRRVVPQPGDLVFSYETRLGQAALVPEGLRCCLGRRMGLIRPLRPRVEPRFLLYAFMGPEFQQTVRERTIAGSTVERILLTELGKYPIRIPALAEQQSVVSLLGALDDKIELNRVMNRTLETIASALFRSWFVDFDPVVAKAAGRQPVGMSTDVAGEFPDSFSGAVSDPIPNGWRLASIYDVTKVVYGAPFSSKLFNGDHRGLPLLRIRDLVSQDPEVFTDESHPNAERVAAGDVVVGMDGEFRAVIWQGPESWLNQRLCKFIPKGTAGTTYVYHSIFAPLAEFERSKVGTTVTHLGKADIDTFKVIHPGDKILALFSTLTQPLIDRILANAAESQVLSDLRDGLLPRLLSGEIRVNQAERIVEQAV